VTTVGQHSDLARQIEELLGRYGVAGAVTFDGDRFVLSGFGPKVTATAGEDAQRLEQASERERRLIAERVARELSSSRRALMKTAKGRSAWLEWLRLIGGIAVVSVGVWGAWRLVGRPAIQSAKEAAFSDDNAPSRELERSSGASLLAQRTRTPPTPKRDERSPASKCESVRSRVSVGGSVSPLDVDGWVVELRLLSEREDLGAQHHALAQFFASSEVGAVKRVIWEEEPAFRAAASPSTMVQILVDPLAQVFPRARSGIRVLLMGQYASFYFDEGQRLKLTRLASALYEAVSANVGAMYARCADGRTHHLGSWFRAADLGTVSAVLVGTMGLAAEVPHLAEAGLAEEPLIYRRALAHLSDRTRKFDRNRLTLLLAEDGGMLAVRSGAWATITFPFSDGNRATRASLRIAESVGLGPRR
jgi:serine/threonine-protein kinase